MNHPQEPGPVLDRPTATPSSALTAADKALLLRAARIIRAEAEIIKRSCQPWSGPEGKAEKRTYDRYLREERDLRELAKRP